MMSNLDASERAELDALRRFKDEYSSRAITRAFARLETLIEADHDPIMSIRSFRIIAECLTTLKDEISK